MSKTPDWEDIAIQHGFENSTQMFTEYTQRYRTIYEIMSQCFPHAQISREIMVAAIRQRGLSVSFKLDWDAIAKAEGMNSPSELFWKLISEYKSAIEIGKYLGVNKNTVIMQARKLGLDTFLLKAPTSGSIYSSCVPTVCLTIESPCRGCPHEYEDKLFGEHCVPCDLPTQWHDKVFVKRLRQTIMFK